MAQSKVTAIQPNVREWANPKGGTIYYHKVTFENGDSGEYGSSTPQCIKFVVGQVADYEKEIKVNGQYTNVKIIPAKTGAPAAGGGGYSKGGGSGYQKDMSWEIPIQKAIIAQSCMSRAVEVCTGMGKVDDATVLAMTKKLFDGILSISGLDKAIEHQKDKIRAAAAKAAIPPPAPAPVPPPPVQQEESRAESITDDLPFN